MQIALTAQFQSMELNQLCALHDTRCQHCVWTHRGGSQVGGMWEVFECSSMYAACSNIYCFPLYNKGTAITPSHCRMIRSGFFLESYIHFEICGVFFPLMLLKTHNLMQFIPQSFSDFLYEFDFITWSLRERTIAQCEVPELTDMANKREREVQLKKIVIV